MIRFLVPDLNKFIARLSILHRLFDPATARSERGEEPNEESPPPESRSVVMCAVYRETVRILSSQALPNFRVGSSLIPLHNAVIRVCDAVGNVIETHERAGTLNGYVKKPV